MTPLRRSLLSILGMILLSVLLLAFLRAENRTTAPNLGSSQGAGAVRESLQDLWDKMLSHNHTGTDGSSRLKSPYIDGKVILQSANGACWSCGPDNVGTWGCVSAPCPTGG